MTGGTFNASKSVSGALSIFLERDILQRDNASLSLCSRLEFGLQDKTNTGLEVPAICAIAFIVGGLGNNSNVWNGNIQADPFVEIPLSLHYNFGWGSGDYTAKTTGFYLGAGMNYIVADYSDTAGNAQKNSFFGCKLDGGIRFHKRWDINLSNTIPLKSIGQIRRPLFLELTISAYFR